MLQDGKGNISERFKEPYETTNRNAVEYTRLKSYGRIRYVFSYFVLSVQHKRPKQPHIIWDNDLLRSIFKLIIVIRLCSFNYIRNNVAIRRAKSYFFFNNYWCTTCFVKQERNNRFSCVPVQTNEWPKCKSGKHTSKRNNLLSGFAVLHDNRENNNSKLSDN